VADPIHTIREHEPFTKLRHQFSIHWAEEGTKLEPPFNGFTGLRTTDSVSLRIESKGGMYILFNIIMVGYDSWTPIQKECSE